MLPLYEGKMFWQFDHRYGTYEGQTEAQARQGTLPPVTIAQHRDTTYVVRPRYWVNGQEVRAWTAARDLGRWLIAFRDITFAVNERTMIFTAAPVVAFGHKAPLLSLDGTCAERLAFLALANSFVADYSCRQKLAGTSLTFFVVKQLPFPSPETLRKKCTWDVTTTYVEFLATRCLELAYTAHDLDAIREDGDAIGGPFAWDSARRSLIRTELDAAAFHLYGLDREDVKHIMSTFPVAESYEVAAHGEFRQRRLILERFDAMAEADASGLIYESALDPPPGDPSVAHEVPVA